MAAQDLPWAPLVSGSLAEGGEKPRAQKLQCVCWGGVAKLAYKLGQLLEIGLNRRGRDRAVVAAMPGEAELNRIAYEIRGGGLEVHRRLGPGLFESAYMPCLAHELHKRKLEFRTKVPLALEYESVFIPNAYQADLEVEGCVIGELKALDRLAGVHTRQLQTYLRLSGCPLGLLLNFGALRFLDGVVRQVNNFPHGTRRHCDPAEGFAGP